MFFNTLGLICASLCSLLSPNNREVIEPIVPTKEVITGQNWQLYSINTEVLNKGFIDSLFTYNEERFGASSENFYFDLVDLCMNAEVNEYCDFYCGSITDSQGRGIWGFIIDYNMFSPDTFNNYSETTRALKFIRITKSSSASNYPVPGYTFKEFLMTIGFYGVDAQLLAQYPFRCNMYYNTGSVGDYYIVNNIEGFTRYILVNYVSKQSTGGDVFGNLFKEANSTYQSGYNVGYQNGYNDALELSNNETAYTIFSGIIGIALVPINMFLNMFNFEVFGINLAGFVSGILTVAVIVIILRLILGGKSDDK